MTLLNRLRRKTFFRTEWLEPHGEIDVPVPADMAEWDGVQQVLVNPDGPEAADTIKALLEALEGAMPILGRVESNASGLPEFDYVGPRVAKAREAIAKSRGAA